MQTPMLAEPPAAAEEAAVLDADADVSRTGSSSGRGSCSRRSCHRRSSSRAGRAAAGGQDTGSTHNSGSLQEVTTRNHFHNLVLLHYAYHKHLAERTLSASRGFCLYYNRLRNASQWDNSPRFFIGFCACLTIPSVVSQNLFVRQHNFSCSCNECTKLLSL